MLLIFGSGRIIITRMLSLRSKEVCCGKSSHRMYRFLVSESHRLSNLTRRAMASVKIKPNRNISEFNSFGENLNLHDLQPSILYIDPDFCVINKPADVRMTGEFPITVEKLLLHWLPGIKVKSLKWIHQLDFATSGVLCVGLNRKAAAIASSSFELRDVKKQYLAVLQGHVSIGDYPFMQEKLTSFTTLQPSIFEVDGSSLQKRKLDDAREGAISSIVQPTVNEVLGVGTTTWQTEVMEANLQLHYQALTDWKAAHRDDVAATAGDARAHGADSFDKFRTEQPEKWNQFQKIATFSYEDFQRNPKHRKALRKFLKSCGIESETQQSVHTSCLELVTQQERLKEEVANNTETNFEVTSKSVSALGALYKKPTSCPRVYRMAAMDGGQEKEKLIIHIPVAEIPGDFR